MINKERELIREVHSPSELDSNDYRYWRSKSENLAAALETRLNAEVGEGEIKQALDRVENEIELQTDPSDGYTDRLTNDIKTICTAYRQLLRERDKAKEEARADRCRWANELHDKIELEDRVKELEEENIELQRASLDNRGPFK